MTDLAQIKNGEIAELEERLVQQQQAAIDEDVERDELVKELEKQAAEHLSRAVSAEADLDKALVKNSAAIEELTAEREALEAKLSEATLVRTQLEAQVASDVGSVSAELLAVAQSLSELPSCTHIAIPVVDSGASGYKTLLTVIQEMTTAVSAQAASANTSKNEEEVLRLQALAEKLEKKNAKLRDMYKADMTELHAEEGKQRQRAEELAEELAASVRRVDEAASELTRVRGDLEMQNKRRLELEAALSQRDALGPSPSPSAGKAGARLASQRTPMRQDSNKRQMQLAADDATQATLSPISSSALNARTGLLDDQLQLPARKRTAPGAVVSDVQAPASAKVDPLLRTRSNYGDRRRMRRNQNAARPDGLEEQAAEQCVQQ
ncbi:hypothetical protein GGI21_004424 [Coemansia aciculifera]|nr:hypothetical protein GGI21_004424 [Coemansia aciculifera]